MRRLRLSARRFVRTIATAAVIGRCVAMQPASQLCADKSAPGETEQLDGCLLLHHHRLFVPGEGNSGVTRVYDQIPLFSLLLHTPPSNTLSRERAK